MRKDIGKPAAKTQKLSKSRGTIPAPKRRAPSRPRNWARINRTLRRMAFAGLALEIALLLLANPYLRVTKVRVDGAQTLSPQQVFAEAKVPSRTNIFWMALRQPFAHRLAQDPLVDHASRRILLPHTLVLQVAERQPFATLAAEKRYWLMDSKGVPYQELDKAYPGIPLIAVQQGKAGRQIVPGQPLKARWLVQTYGLLGLLAQSGSLAATKISVDQNANICLNRRDHLQIMLGQPEALAQKVALAQAAVSANGGAIMHRAAYIDVSCPELPVWKPRPDATDEYLRFHKRHGGQMLPEDVQRL